MLPASCYPSIDGHTNEDDLGFEIMPGTADADLTPKKKPYKAEAPVDTSGG